MSYVNKRLSSMLGESFQVVGERGRDYSCHIRIFTQFTCLVFHDLISEYSVSLTCIIDVF